MMTIFNMIRRNLWLILATLLALVLLLVLAHLAPVAEAAAGRAAPVAQATPTADQVDAVAKELWCPLCNGVRLDNCDLQACSQMRDLIAQKLAAGQSTDQIKAYFVQQYGDVVLGAPENKGFNRIVYILPVLAALVGLAIVGYLVYIWTRRRPAPAGPSGGPQPPAANDEYTRQVDEELKKYE
jgi:cytochrome c-type biogenesis protein CcmH